MAGRTIAIGDIHGCELALEALLRAIAPQPDDVLIPLGDYIDRGPNSRAVLDRMIELAKQCRLVPLIGNHEIMMLAARSQPSERDFWAQFGGAETMASYGGQVDEFDRIPAEHFQFIQGCHSYHETDQYIFLHANFVADLPLQRQPEYTLFWEHLSTYVPPRHVSGKTAIVGHTPQYEGEVLDLGHVVCIDTFCVGGGWLTALEVPSRKIWQASQSGQLRDGT